MRRIAGPGHVANQFVDYEEITNPNGTVYTAAFGNDVQNELIGIQDYAGVSEAPGTSRFVLASMIRAIKEHSKPVGELFALAGPARQPTAFDPANPHSYFPAVCLTDFAVFTTISQANYPDFEGAPGLFSMLYGYRAAFRQADTVQGQLTVSAWSVAGGIATFTLEAQNAERNALAALTDDYLVHSEQYGGDYTNWRTITLPAAIGNVAAGTFRITGVDPDALTLSCDTGGAAAGSGSVTAIVEIYPYRVAGSSDTVRLFSQRGRATVGAGSDDHVAGLRHRDRFQGHWHEVQVGSNTGGTRWGAGNIDSDNRSPQDMLGAQPPVNPIDAHWFTAATEIQLDFVHGDPRVDSYTQPRAVAAHLYLHAGRYV